MVPGWLKSIVEDAPSASTRPIESPYQAHVRPRVYSRDGHVPAG